MGMFDYITNKLYCPFCGELQEENDFQTKSFVNAMIGIDIDEIKEDESCAIYSTCRKCNKHIHLLIDGWRKEWNKNMFT